jgi:hypothetical protein
MMMIVKGSYLADHILFHKAAAIAMAWYVAAATAKQQPSLILLLAPIQDVRFLNGMNGCIP